MWTVGNADECLSNEHCISAGLGFEPLTHVFESKLMFQETTSILVSYYLLIIYKNSTLATQHSTQWYFSYYFIIYYSLFYNIE